LQQSKVLTIFIQIVQGIQYFHHQNIVRRNLKISNLFCEGNGKVKVGDFFTAREITNSLLEMPTIESPLYASPEVIFEQECGFGVDVWSLGCILYEMMTGKTPFEANSLEEFISNVLQTEPDPITVNYFSDLKNLLKKMLIKDDNERITIDEINNEPIVVSFKLKHESICSSKIPLLLQFHEFHTGQEFPSFYFSSSTSSNKDILQLLSEIPLSVHLNEISVKKINEGNFSFFHFLS
jgi:serine/threonine protein kinase